MERCRLSILKHLDLLTLRTRPEPGEWSSHSNYSENVGSVGQNLNKNSMVKLEVVIWFSRLWILVMGLWTNHETLISCVCYKHRVYPTCHNIWQYVRIWNYLRCIMSEPVFDTSCARVTGPHKKWKCENTMTPNFGYMTRLPVCREVSGDTFGIFDI